MTRLPLPPWTWSALALSIAVAASGQLSTAAASVGRLALGAALAVAVGTALGAPSSRARHADHWRERAQDLLSSLPAPVLVLLAMGAWGSGPWVSPLLAGLVRGLALAGSLRTVFTAEARAGDLEGRVAVGAAGARTAWHRSGHATRDLQAGAALSGAALTAVAEAALSLPGLAGEGLARAAAQHPSGTLAWATTGLSLLTIHQATRHLTGRARRPWRTAGSGR